MTSVDKPAETVEFAASMVQYVDSTYGFYWQLGTDEGWASMGNIDSPACGNPMTAWCGGGWGNNYNWTGLIEAKAGDTNGFAVGRRLDTCRAPGRLHLRGRPCQADAPRSGGAGHELDAGLGQLQRRGHRRV